MYAIEREVDRLPQEGWQRLKAVAEQKRVAEQGSQRWRLHVPLRNRFREVLFSRHAVLIATFFIFAAIVHFVARELAPTLQTTIGEQRVVELQDGSRIHLNTNTRIRVQFSDSLRIVELLSGEAMFTVAHDAQRPFLVMTGDAAVRAVGTVFNVHRDRDLTTVSVFEGRVRILEGTSRKAHRLVYAELAASDEAQVSPGSMQPQVEVRKLNPTALRQRHAWTQGLLLLNGESLQYAIRQFNRYHREQVMLDDPAQEFPRLGGVFRLYDLEEFLGAMTQAHGLVAEASGPPEATVIHLRRSD